MSNMDYSTSTEGQTKIHTLIWTVPKFNELLESKFEREFRTENPTDDSVESIDSKFYLKLQSLGRNNDIIEIYFLSPNPVFLKLSLKVLDKRGTRPIVTKEYHTVQGNKWQYLGTLFKRDIKDRYAYDNTFLSDGNLRLEFQFMIIDDIKIDRSNVPETLSINFENLLNNGMFSDVTMKSAEGNEYKVHKAVLASRSVVLKAHFEHNTIECQTNIVESPLEAEVLVEVSNIVESPLEAEVLVEVSNIVESPLEAEVLVEVLCFIYSDKAPRIDEIPERLLAAANYYQLSGLKSLCEQALYKRLTVENAIETLQLADLQCAEILKRLTLEFIKDGQANLIIKTEGWANVKSVELIKTLYEYIMTDNIEADIE